MSTYKLKKYLEELGFKLRKNDDNLYTKSFNNLKFKAEIHVYTMSGTCYPLIGEYHLNEISCKTNKKNIDYWNDYFYNLQLFDRAYHKKK